MQPRDAIPTVSVVEADSAHTARDAASPGWARPVLLDVRERHEFVAVRAPGPMWRGPLDPGEGDPTG